MPAHPIDVRYALGQAAAMAQEHWRLLAVYVALGAALPFLLLSTEQIFSVAGLVLLLDGGANYGAYVTGSIAGPIYLVAIVAVLTTGGMFAAWSALLSEIREGYIAEIMSGMVAGFAYLAVTLIINLALAWIFVGHFFDLVNGSFWRRGTAVACWLVWVWLSSRFCLVGPIMAAEGRIMPFSTFIASWRLTRPSQIRLFILYFILNLVSAVVGGAMLALHIYWLFEPVPGVSLAMLTAAWFLFWVACFLTSLLVAAGLHRAAHSYQSVGIFL